MTDLSGRELASLAWMAVAGGAGVFWRPIRDFFTAMASALAVRVFLVPAGLFALYSAVVVALVSRTPAWSPDLLKDALIWFFAVGLALMLRAANAAKEPHWFRHQAARSVRLTVFVEFYLNVHTLDFWPEFLLQGWLIVLILFDGSAQLEEIRGGKTLTGLKRAVRLFQAITGLALFGVVAVWLVGNWQTLDLAGSARELFLPVWLTLASLPFLYWLVWYLTWDSARSQLAQFGSAGRVGIRNRLALLLGYHVRIGDMRRFANNWARQVSEKRTLRGKLRVIGEHRAGLRAEVAAKRKKADELVRYAGSDGVDAHGRRLDRREFDATIRALELVSNSEMGWYANAPKGHYKAKVADFLPALARDLPEDHGITLGVRTDGRAWYAWRRTITGWVFAIGAAAAPPDQRFYDGPEPPDGFPGPKGRWGRAALDRGPNWEP